MSALIIFENLLNPDYGFLQDVTDVINLSCGCLHALKGFLERPNDLHNLRVQPQCLEPDAAIPRQVHAFVSGTL